MAINLITGQPRNGKSMREIAKILDVYVKQNDKREEEGKGRRKIYTDIDGINAPDTVTKLPDCITDLTKKQKETIWFGEHDDPNKPENFWCPDYGSIFIFDECHKLEWVKETSGSVSKNPVTNSLNEHGHAGHDIDLLTQFPQYIHTHIRGLVQEHWHVKRIAGLRQAWVYKWDEFMLNPRAKVSLDSVFEKERFKFNKRYENAYKSASAHAPIKFKFPKQMLWVIIPFCIIAILFAWKFSHSMFAEKAGLKEKDEKQKAEQIEKDKQLQANQNQQAQQIQDLQAELKQLKEQYLPKHIATLAQFEEVRPAMVIEHGGACQSFNKYGEPLNLPDSLCMQMSSYSAMIPRSRQTQELSEVQQQKQINGISDSSGQSPQPQQNSTDVQYFDHNKDFPKT